MGSIGASRQNPARETITDDYGRTYPIVSVDNVPEGYSVWASGTWRGANENYNNGYVVFADINQENGHVNTDSAVVVRVSGDDATAIRDVVAVDEQNPVKKAEQYAKRYANAKYASTRARAERWRKAADAMKRLGLS